MKFQDVLTYQVPVAMIILCLKKIGSEDSIVAIDLRVDERFLGVMGIDLLAGNNLPPADTGRASFILVNETTTKALGYQHPAEIVGEIFEDRGEQVTVAGVFQDITFFLLFSKKPTGPIALRNEPDKFNFANIKITPDNQKEVLAQLEKKWATVDPLHPFKYELYQDKLANYNQGVFDLVAIVGFFAFVSVTIACLGLLGISIYTTERRTKEVGIRKVLGANGFGLALLLSKEFLYLLLIAIFIAAPLSYFLNNLWLNYLIIRVDFHLSFVILGSLILLALGILVIGPQTIRISNTNPVNSLKQE